jgi:outer membrane protein OmpA-like peptidoglycan-associated protein
VKKKQHQYATLYDALIDEFKSTPEIRVYKDLRITHDGLIFKQGSSTLTAAHKSVLDDFMPRLLKVLKGYKEQVKNLQINGYTSTEWNAPMTQRYLNNTRLSNDRAMHILEYSYQLKRIEVYQEWISQILSTDGHSYSNLIYADDKENKIRSRRVEFEITIK